VSDVDGERRRWLGGAAAAVAVVIAPGVTLFEAARAKDSGTPVSSRVRWGMLIDTNRCTSECSACVAACNRENGLSGRVRETDAQWIRKIELREVATGKTHSLPMMCQHCARPPCVDVCPTGASFKRADGIVLVDRHACIGCRYCMMACPYKARSFVHEPLSDQVPDVPRGMGTVEACTLCVQRIDRGERPACVDACAAVGHDAIVFGDLNDRDSDIARRLVTYGGVPVRADLRLDPGIRYHGL
jgi:molybdopterin-containing oxidoreductase family iron-sulfur binding subunit